MSARPLSDPIQTWLFEQLAQGTPPGRLVSALEREGLAPAAASRMIREALLRPRAMPPPPGTAPVAEVPADFWPAHFPFRHAHELEFEGHRIRLLARLADPAVALFDHVLSDAECDALMDAARPRLARSEVIDTMGGGYRPVEERSSDGTALGPDLLPMVERLQARMAWLMGVSPARAERLQVLRYGVGGQYLPHHDYFDLPATQGGQRCATLVTYLADVDAGGATAFPELGLAFTPRRGMGVYFAYADATARLDPRSLHAGTPVGRGEKWIATQWVRLRPRG